MAGARRFQFFLCSAREDGNTEYLTRRAAGIAKLADGESGNSRSLRYSSLKAVQRVINNTTNVEHRFSTLGGVRRFIQHFKVNN